jgi:acyl-CoA thioesterase-1
MMSLRLDFRRAGRFGAGPRWPAQVEGSYGCSSTNRHQPRRGLRVALAVALTLVSGSALARTVKLVALGDSLTAGYMLPADAAFPAVLEQALRAKGYDVEVANAGVSGDTASDGLARVDWSVPPDADAVIVELGANDMLRGLDPALTRKVLAELLTKLQGRGVKVLLAGMRATPSFGKDYVARFDAIYPALGQQFGVPVYPFFLDGIAGNPKLNLPDGLHPKRAGVDVIVSRILPAVEALVRSVGS